MALTLPEPRLPSLLDSPVLRWGVIAPGSIAGSFVDALQKHTRQRVVAVGSRSLERAEQFASRFGIERASAGYEAVVEDPQVDVVYIASPHSEHARQALLAIAAGKHILVEKPFAPTPGEAEMIVHAARDAGVFAMEAMWMRYLPHMDVVRQLLADGAVGEPAVVSADFGAAFDFDPASRIFDPALAGGALLDVGVYASSFVSMVAGTPQSTVVSGSLTSTGVDATATIVGSHAHDVQSVATSTVLADTRHAASVAGRAGRIDVHPSFWTPGGVTLTRGSESGSWTDGSPLQGGEGLAWEALHVAQYVSEGRTESPLHPLDEVVAVVRTLDDARRRLGVSV
ncbi:Gfo/Idh/MocA family protein [Rathayibacter rathayi]|uniref:Gfo/Idh/MocA family protein n=1 Tax=Rathayibacter rathayi TaxID=33887 RepID=UPI000BD1BE2E|nr:Gfo/Idh/MocA family oxidoreductase [Rathayibacter rathayi]AZZ49549.1 gfo/Idh/MocA family oxidoreductase [Rathayibacter rathayi]MWV73666.1 gfo/Idh/MocA family oxidoreductase [Rathayibacter rathayi NCPPB 2980 = VKM Ac-1601]PPF23753.1 gfo/Idh/MocA family oxidoreductase [Rathayibacter rathayi]PPF48241.1 gfo/Idh/MocA family oxidoreductase [Rathayibacter rathayi]PPF79966.1 gfo/Idh/MocA family oxidoreductase [Rathayibacter rathayi]